MSLHNAMKSAAEIGKVVQQYNRWIVETSRDDHSHDDGKLHPSSVGGCPTSSAYSMLGFAQEFKPSHDARGLRIFSMGTFIHLMIQSGFYAANIIEEDPKQKGKPYVEILATIAELNLEGRADGIILPDFTRWGTRAILEIKSINSNGFKALKGPKPDHILQATAYYVGLVERGILRPEENEVIFIYYAKDTSEIKEYNIQIKDSHIADMKQRGNKIWEMVRAFSDRNEFPAPYYDTPNRPPCSYCQWKSLCHDTFIRKDFIERMSHAPTPQTTGKKTASRGIPRRRPRVSVRRK